MSKVQKISKLQKPPSTQKLSKQVPKSKKNTQYQPLTRLSCFNILFIILSLFMIIHLIYLYAQQPAQFPKISYLHRIFTNNKYNEYLNKLAQNKYGIIKSQCSECVDQLIRYHSLKTKQKIILRDYTKLQANQQIYMPYLWSIKMLVNKYVTQPLPKPKIWIIHTNNYIPKQQIQQIMQIQPKNSIYLIIPTTLKKVKIDGFKKLGTFNTFNIQQIFKQANLPLENAQIYKNYHNNSISNIFTHISQKSSSLQTQLGKYYININNLSKKNKKVLNSFCLEGKIKSISNLSQKNLLELQKYGLIIGNDIQQDLLGYGVKVGQKIPYWKNDKYRLNYMLQSKKNCVKVDVPQFVQQQQENQEENIQQCPPCQCNIQVSTPNNLSQKQTSQNSKNIDEPNIVLNIQQQNKQIQQNIETQIQKNDVQEKQTKVEQDNNINNNNTQQKSDDEIQDNQKSEQNIQEQVQENKHIQETQEITKNDEQQEQKEQVNQQQQQQNQTTKTEQKTEEQL